MRLINKNMFIFIILILLSSFITATLPKEDNLLVYYYPTNVSTTVVDESINTTQYNATAINNPTLFKNDSISYYNFSGTNEELNNSYTNPIIDNISISMWINLNSITGNHELFAKGTSTLEILQINDEFQFFLRNFGDSDYHYADTTTANLNTNTWYHVVFVYNSYADDFDIYLNNVSLFLTVSGIGPGIKSSTSNMFFASRGGANYYDGSINNILVYNNYLNSSDVSEIYALGQSNYYGTVSPNMTITNHTITPDILNYQDNLTTSANISCVETIVFEWLVNDISVKNETDKCGICYQEFANVSTTCGGLNTGSYETGGLWFGSGASQVQDGDDGTAGSCLTGSAYLEVNYTIPDYVESINWSIKSDNVYLNYTIPSQCIYNDNLTLKIELIAIINTTFYCYNSTQWVYIGHDTGTILYEEKIYWNYGDIQNYSTLNYTNYNLTDIVTSNIVAYNGSFNETSQVNKTVGQTITFNASNILTNTTIENFTITYDEGSFLANGSSLTIYNWNETDEYFFTHPDYQNSSVSLTTNIAWQSYEFILYTTNSVNFIFRYASNDSLTTGLSKTVFLYGNSLNYTYNFTTTDSGYYIDLLNPEIYTVSTNAPGYSQTSFLLQVVNNTFKNTTVYLYENSTSTKISYSVLSALGDKLENARVQALFYVNESWKVVSECLTSSLGICSMYLDQNEWYYYYVFYSDPTTPDLITETPEYLDYTTRSPFILTLAENQFADYYFYDDKATIINFSYTNSSVYNYTFRLQGTYSDPIDTLCILLYANYPNGTVLEDSECMVSSGDIIYLNYLFSNYTYTIQAVSQVDGNNYPLESLYFSFANNDVKQRFGLEGVFICFLIVLFGFTLGLATGDPLNSMLGSIGGIIFSQFMGFIHLNTTTIIVMIITGLIILIRNREPGQ